MRNHQKITSLLSTLAVLVFLSSCGGSVTPQKPPTTNSQPPLIKSSIPNGVENSQQSNSSELFDNQRFSGVLAAHNRVRAKHNLPPLSWSNDLAKISQNWANNLAKGNSCQMYHTGGNPPFGENLYRASAIMWSDGRREIQAITIKQVVKAWTDEEKWYDYQNNRCQPGKQCGHYTQAVWKGTTEVGCAMNVCADKSQSWVCSYFPAGNVIGARPY